MADVFLAGATGFLGRALAHALASRDYRVTALARRLPTGLLPSTVTLARGNALDAATFQYAVPIGCTYVHLIGTAKPAPWKGRQFAAVDLAGLEQALIAARAAGSRHFVYVSVAQPAPVMQSYIRIRRQCEAHIRDSGIPATILRPWYVLGPGRWWPLALAPFYRLGELLGSPSATRLGLLTREEMIAAMLWAIERPDWRILDVPSIRLLGRNATAAGRTSPCPDPAR